MTEMETLFASSADLSPETMSVSLLNAFVNGDTDPRTLDGWDDDIKDKAFDYLLYGNARIGKKVKIPTLGTFKAVAIWGGVAHGSEMGLVLLHVETGVEYLLTSTYNSWEIEEYEVSEAEEYTFTEQRWRVKNG